MKKRILWIGLLLVVSCTEKSRNLSVHFAKDKAVETSTVSQSQGEEPKRQGESPITDWTLPRAAEKRNESSSPKNIEVTQPEILLDTSWRSVLIGNEDPVVLMLRLEKKFKFYYSIHGSGYFDTGSGNFTYDEEGRLNLDQSIIATGPQRLEIRVEDTSVSVSDTTMRLQAVTLNGKIGNLSMSRLDQIPIPSYGVILHDDGDNSFQRYPERNPMWKLKNDFATMALNSGVKTVSYCIGTGTMYFTPKRSPASYLGRNSYPYYENKPEWIRILHARAGFKKGMNPIRVAGEEIKRKGLHFFLSHRINDGHFTSDPGRHPNTPRLYRLFPNLIIGKARTPVPGHERYGTLPDFTYERVRKYNVDLMEDAAIQYGDLIDGFEIDFMRSPFLFPKGTGWSRRHLVTKMIREFRGRLDAVGEKYGKRIPIILRIPPTLRHAHRAGIYVEELVTQGLVQVLVPAQLMTIAYDNSIENIVSVAKASGVAVYPAIYSRRKWSRNFTKSLRDRQYLRGDVAKSSDNQVRGAALNYYAQGASGVQLYNWAARAWIRAPWFWKLSKDLAAPEKLKRSDYVIGITPGYYADYTDIYQPRKQIPKKLGRRTWGKFNLLLEAPPFASQASEKKVFLRLGIRIRTLSDLRLDIVVNGITLFRHSSETKPFRVAVKNTAPVPVASAYVQIPVRGASIFRKGNNVIAIRSYNKPVDIRTIELGSFQ